MTRRIRRIIFYLFLAIFIILVLIIILYSWGYSFDFDKKIIVSTGALYLKSYPQKAEIYINGKFKGKTTGFIRRLIPKIYEIKITKEDYHSWQKNLTIRPGLVTRVDDIFLVPFNPKISLTTQNQVRSFSLLPDEKQILYLASSSFHLIDIPKNEDKEILELNPRHPMWEIRSPTFIWAPDNENVIIRSKNTYYLLNIKNPEKITNLNELIKNKSRYSVSNINNLNFDLRSEKIYFLSNNNLYSLELNKGNINNFLLSPILGSNFVKYLITGDRIIYLEYFSGQIYELNLTTLKSGPLFEQVFPSFNEGEWILSNDKGKLLCKKNQTVEILWLWDSVTHKKGDLEKFNLEKTIEDIIWLSRTDSHLIFSTNDSILVTELDNRLPRNTINFITTENPQIKYDAKTATLYFLSQERLYQTEL